MKSYGQLCAVARSRSDENASKTLHLQPCEAALCPENDRFSRVQPCPLGIKPKSLCHLFKQPAHRGTYP